VTGGDPDDVSTPWPYRQHQLRCPVPVALTVSRNAEHRVDDLNGHSGRGNAGVSGKMAAIPQMADDASDACPREVESTLRLIERARGGDPEAVDRLFARYLKPLTRWATGRLPKWAREVTDTDDLVQDTLLRTFKRIGEFEPRGVGSLQAYLRQAVLNGVREELRRKGRQPEATDLDGLEADSHLSPLEQAIGAEAVGRYERALERLKPAEREAVIGRVEMGYSYEELAEVLGKPSADAARKAAQRALVRLVEEMDGDVG
jgi:RNA polymerase sigma-70 factor, ECF subfamily